MNFRQEYKNLDRFQRSEFRAAMLTVVMVSESCWRQWLNRGVPVYRRKQIWGIINKLKK